MAKVYIVTSGSYSDYGIKACFSTLEKADRYVSIPGVDGNVEEYELDIALEPYNRGLTFYTVKMLEHGDVVEAKPDDPTYTERFYKYKDHGDPSNNWTITCGFMLQGWYKSEEHAIKVCNEKRAQWIALHTEG